jgi:hypothetical protein
VKTLCRLHPHPRLMSIVPYRVGVPSVAACQEQMNSPSAQRCNGWAFFHRAYLALCAAAIFLRAAGDILRLWAEMETTLFPLTLAQRARLAAEIRARPAADIVVLPVLLFEPFSAESALLRRSS